jgi:inhibitor of cysteine peptidase
VTLTQADNGRRVTVAPGEVIEIRLPETASGGYRWDPEASPDAVFEPLERASDYGAAGVGSSGEAILRFRAKAGGPGSIALRYWRPWEGEGSITKRFEVTVDAAP